MIRKEFQKEMESLHNEVSKMGVSVENQIDLTIKAIINEDVTIAEKVVAADDEIDRMEKEISIHCINIIALQQPVARDLRGVTAVLKLITDLEIIADHAEDICSTLLHFFEIPRRPEIPEDIIVVANISKEMLRNAINSFISYDFEVAKEIITKDDYVDKLYFKIRTQLIKKMTTDENNAEALVELLEINKYFEKIADHTQNVAKWVIFDNEGRWNYMHERI